MIKPEEIDNRFFNEHICCYDHKELFKNLSLSDVLYAVFGHSTILPKRLSSPITIHNARIYTNLCKDKYAWKGDINIYRSNYLLKRISDMFGVELYIFSESSNHCYWRSSEPDMYNGHFYINGKLKTKGTFFECIEYFEKEYEKQRNQWLVDHRIKRRSVKEFIRDATLYIKYSILPLLKKVF